MPLLAVSPNLPYTYSASHGVIKFRTQNAQTKSILDNCSRTPNGCRLRLTEILLENQSSRIHSVKNAGAVYSIKTDSGARVRSGGCFSGLISLTFYHFPAHLTTTCPARCPCLPLPGCYFKCYKNQFGDEGWRRVTTRSSAINLGPFSPLAPSLPQVVETHIKTAY